MIRTLLVEFLFPLLVFFLLRGVLRSVFTGSSTSSVPRRAPAGPPPPVQSGGELKKDPVCGTYVSTSTSVTRTVNGKVVHFCSPECRDRYTA